jgi:hypothetical protein
MLAWRLTTADRVRAAFATHTGPFQAQLGSLCEQLLVAREQQDRDSQEELYSDSLRLLSGGNDQVCGVVGLAVTGHGCASHCFRQLQLRAPAHMRRHPTRVRRRPPGGGADA